MKRNYCLATYKQTPKLPTQATRWTKDALDSRQYLSCVCRQLRILPVHHLLTPAIERNGCFRPPDSFPSHAQLKAKILNILYYN